MPFSDYGSFSAIQADLSLDKPVFVLLGTGTHRVKKKAEQMACEEALEELELAISSSTSLNTMSNKIIIIF